MGDNNFDFVDIEKINNTTTEDLINIIYKNNGDEFIKSLILGYNKLLENEKIEFRDDLISLNKKIYETRINQIKIENDLLTKYYGVLKKIDLNSIKEKEQNDLMEDKNNAANLINTI